MADEEFSSQVQRALGRLEGQFSALETRLTNLDTRVDRQLNLLAGEVRSVRSSIASIETSLGSFRGTISGNWHSIVIVAICLFSIGQLIVSLVGLFHK